MFESIQTQSNWKCLGVEESPVKHSHIYTNLIFLDFTIISFSLSIALNFLLIRNDANLVQ